jgi:hypothetical protein
MVAKWILEYFIAPSTWIPLQAKFNQTVEELNGHEQGDITLPNTSANRAIVASNKTVRISFDTHVIYTGQLSALSYSAAQLKCVLYNAVYEAMKAKTITADYSAGEAADVIFAAICAAAGVTVGACPSTTIAVRFIDAECYTSAMFLADVLNSNYYASGGTFTIGAVGSLKTASHYKIQSRGIDRAKKRDKVRVRGVSSAGIPITGEAGTGTDVKVYIENKVSDQASLDSLAAKYLADLNTDSQGAPLVFPITEAYDFHPGDTFAVTNARYNLAGTYAMKSITKTSTKVTVALDVAPQTLEQMIVDFQKYEDYGIYGGLIPTTLSHQNLELYLYMNEGQDIYIADYGPFWRQGIGYAITWGAEGNICTFDGTSSFINCGNDFDPEGTDQLTVMAWITPITPAAPEKAYVIYRDNFSLKCTENNTVTAGIVTAGHGWTLLTTPVGSIPEGVRTFVLMRYNGSKLQIFINGSLSVERAITGLLSWVSFMPMLIGAMTHVDGFYKGGLDHIAVFSRFITDREIADIYFYNGILNPPPYHAVNNLDLSGLELLIHANEGSGAAITDSLGKGYVGAIHGAAWSADAIPKLTFAATDYVEVPQVLPIEGLGAISVGAWVKPSSLGDKNYLIKNAQFSIQLKDDGVWVTIAGNTVTAQFELVQLNERIFVMGVYDGAHLIVYVNGTERMREDQTGTIGSAAGSTFIGAIDDTGQKALNGYLQEIMVWTRGLSREEVVMLYFFPLTQIIGGGGGAISGWILTVSHGAGASCSPEGVVNVGSGQSVQVEVTITPGSGYWFSGWFLDGHGAGKDNPLIIASKPDGSIHTLVAQTSSPSNKNTRFYIVNIPPV